MLIGRVELCLFFIFIENFSQNITNIIDRLIIMIIAASRVVISESAFGISKSNIGVGFVFGSMCR